MLLALDSYSDLAGDRYRDVILIAALAAAVRLPFRLAIKSFATISRASLSICNASPTTTSNTLSFAALPEECPRPLSRMFEGRLEPFNLARVILFKRSCFRKNEYQEQPRWTLKPQPNTKFD